MNGFGHLGALLAAILILCAGMVAHPVAASALTATAVVRDGQHDFDDSFGVWNVQVGRLDRSLTGSHKWIGYRGPHTITPLWQ